MSEIIPSDAPENLCVALDADIRVVGKYPRYSVQLIRAGEVVSSTGVFCFAQQMGSSKLQVAGIGGVGTPEKHRRKGYSRIVMLNALRWMAQHDFDAALLFGIERFYQKFGYAMAFPDVSHALAVDAVVVKNAPSLRPKLYSHAQSSDARDALRLYRLANQERVGMMHRTAQTWNYFRRGMSWGARPEVTLLRQPQTKKAVAYYVRDLAADAFRIIEVACPQAKYLPTLLAQVVRKAQQAPAPKIYFSLPEDDSLMRYCQPYGLRRETDFRQDGGAMVRLVNVKSTLEKCAPELARHLAQAGESAGAVSLITNSGAAGLSWQAGTVKVHTPKPGVTRVHLPQWALAQLLYGYTSADALCAAGQLRGSAKAIQITSRLFPPRSHYYFESDFF